MESSSAVAVPRRRPASLARRALRLLRGNPVCSIAGLCALVSMLFVTPDAAYLGYIEPKTLACLFCFFACVNALRDLDVFKALANRLLGHFASQRTLVAALVALTAAVSAIATNDVALVMLLPLSTEILRRAGCKEAIPRTFVLQTIAANLCGMVTPFGNPQNMYLYSHFALGLGAFFSVVIRPFAVSAVLLAACCFLLIKPVVLDVDVDEDSGEDAVGEKSAHFAVRLAVVVGLFGLSVLSLTGVVWYGVSFAVVAGVLLVLDREAVRGVDYGLLLTFVFFFVFAGNLARIPQANDAIVALVGADPLLATALASQVISNVPAALLLSNFTGDYAALLAGANIGGVGTPIASLASIITISYFGRLCRSHSHLSFGRFMGLFLLLNVAFLAVLLLLS